jgi:hypothetical protein
MTEFSLKQRVTVVNHLVNNFTNLWQTLIQPTLRGERIEGNHVDFCRHVRAFIAVTNQLRILHEQHPHALAFQAALAPYHGIESMLQLKSVQVVMFKQCESLYRKMKHEIPERKRPGPRNVHTSKRLKLTTTESADESPLSEEDLEKLFQRPGAQKRKRSDLD